jgi:iron complex transport system permease protein
VLNTRTLNGTGVVLGLSVGLVAVVLVAIALGAVLVPVDQVGRMLVGRLLPGLVEQTWTVGDEQIIFDIRLLRVMGCLVVGMSLGAAGAALQGIMRNPLADPYIIGTSGGAGLGATLAMLMPFHMTLLGMGLVPVMAFLGAFIAVMLVYNVAKVGARAPMVTLLLAGFAVSSMMAAILSFLMVVSGDALRQIVIWLMGGVTVVSWTQLLIIVPLFVVGTVALYLYAPALNAFLLGEEQAKYLGVDVERCKLLILMLAALLTGAAVSISGLVGFVGLVVPHVSRLLFGPDHRLLLPASTIVGGIFLVLADLLARSLLPPTEIPVGVVTALCGSPFFIYLLRRSRREYGL